MQHVGQERAVADAGHGQPQPPQPPHVQVAAESGERLAFGERGRDRREQIAPVEGARKRRCARGRARYVDALEDASEALGGEHQQSVVRSHEQAILRGGAQRDRAARALPDGPHARIDDREVDARGHERQRPGQHQRPRAHVVRGDAVREVDHVGARAAPRDHPVADADELVLQSVVGEKGDDGRGRAWAAHRVAG